MAGQQQQCSSGAAQDNDIFEKYTCPICLDLFQTPVRMVCGHIFCASCLHQCTYNKNFTCGVCRRKLKTESCAMDLIYQMEKIEESCKGCNKKVKLSKMREHLAACSKYEKYVMNGIKSVKMGKPQEAGDVPNRFTFTCPYCQEHNLSQEGLVDHCKRLHMMDPTPVVLAPSCCSLARNMHSGN
ncbi:E3 ubiquitin-protein ligase RNF114 isoform X2 [Xenopus laevis]|uniref:RING-type E3 ubiquitin transferase n=1 Tax=Xenopus laevis TaxID=8355 RepID=A0A8J0U0W0_XENLA|nr:E3 ubiquitin-protein ligase RNF114 isoform X2 [Xenopus laevis]